MASLVDLDGAEVVETCFARLYRTADEVLKIRKPTRLMLDDELIDLSSVEHRHAACLEEANLDRRLAPGVVRGVFQVTPPESAVDVSGSASRPVEWALRMRRLPDRDRADKRLASGRLTDANLRDVAQRLATIHERARSDSAGAGDSSLDRLRRLVRMRVHSPGAKIADAPSAEVEAIEAWQLAFLETQSDRIQRRAASTALREGLGELSLDHVFIDDAGDVQILAGLEMSPRWRHSDVAADVALLATDLAARHRVDLAERFVAEYARFANDFDLYPLLDFYSSLRATLRAKLDTFSAEHLAPSPALAQRYRERAHRFLVLAASAPRRALLPPIVVVLGGQVASGKSTVATHIGQRIGAPVVGSDPTRDFLLGARLNQDLHEAHWEKSYELGFAERVYAEVLRRAGEVLESGRPVVIDGCFRSRRQRALARKLAEKFGHPFLFVEACVAEDVQLERLAERADRDSVQIEDWKQIADSLRAQWESADDLPEAEHVSLDTALSLDHNAEILEAILPTWPPELTG
jgi:aminoglycoside phosphotransferase family enzyme/predicted kinase